MSPRKRGLSLNCKLKRSERGRRRRNFGRFRRGGDNLKDLEKETRDLEASETIAMTVSSIGIPPGGQNIMKSKRKRVGSVKLMLEMAINHIVITPISTKRLEVVRTDLGQMIVLARIQILENQAWQELPSY